MFRTARRITPLLGRLLFGAITTTTVLVAGGAMVGCADENDPKTHIKKLEDPAYRPNSIKRLIQFFEDAMANDKGNREGPSVKPLLDTIIEPLSSQCVNSDLDDRTRSNLVKFLSDARDPRAEPCFIKVLKDYKVDATEEDVRWTARAVGSLKLKGAAGPLFEVFVKLRTSKPKADAIYRDVHDALLELADPAWEAQLITLVSRPINDRKDGTILKDEMFWQITAAELLGILKSTNGVKPLIKAILSPNKVELGNTALNALIKIGKPSIAPTMALLKNEDKDLAEYSKLETLKATPPGSDGKVPASATKAAENAHIGTAASILAAIGREEATTTLIEAAEKADDVTRVIITRDFINLPSTPALVKSFQTTYEKTPLSLTAPLIGGAREALLDRASVFFDSSFTPWIVKTAMEAKGEPGDIDPIRVASLASAMKIMTVEQVSLVDGLYNLKSTGADGKPSFIGKSFLKEPVKPKEGETVKPEDATKVCSADTECDANKGLFCIARQSGTEKVCQVPGEYKLCKDLLAACTDKVECYLAKLAEPETHRKETIMTGIKAIYMVGILGTPEVKTKLIELMPKLTNGDVRGLAGVVIDRFSPKGDPAIAAALQKIVDEAEASKDSNKKAANSSFKQVIYRLNARADK